MRGRPGQSGAVDSGIFHEIVLHKAVGQAAPARASQLCQPGGGEGAANQPDMGGANIEIYKKNKKNTNFFLKCA